MNYEKLFMMQQALDAHIETKHGLTNEDLFDQKVLALLVELGELANETRCFKFWSLKPSSSRETILEEYVDGVHFILSLGIVCGYAKESLPAGVQAGQDLNEQFLTVYDKINVFKKTRSLPDYTSVFQAYLQLGGLLGFSEADVEQAYVSKNEVNYQRQQAGY